MKPPGRFDPTDFFGMGGKNEASESPIIVSEETQQTQPDEDVVMDLMKPPPKQEDNKRRSILRMGTLAPVMKKPEKSL